jgi:midasin
VRLNNHEHTDIAEYMGTYVSSPTGGAISFVEGALVTAVRRGHWIVLDELNLAPSDVLEALNRLLDDNRELFVPELQETVRRCVFSLARLVGFLCGGEEGLSALLVGAATWDRFT